MQNQFQECTPPSSITPVYQLPSASPLGPDPFLGKGQKDGLQDDKRKGIVRYNLRFIIDLGIIEIL